MTGDDLVTWPEVLEHVHAAFLAGYDLGTAHGRHDTAQDAAQDAAHDLACRTIGIRDDTGPVRWDLAS